MKIINFIFYSFALVITILPFSLPQAKGVDLFDRYYIGGGTGIAVTEFSSKADRDDFPASDQESFHSKHGSAVMSYIQLGKDWQLDNEIIVGAIIDYSWFNNRYRKHGLTGDFATVSSHDSYSIKIKLGYPLNQRTLAYGILGVGSLRGKFKFQDDNGSSGTKSLNGARMILGGGINYFTPYSDNWSLSLEALYYPSGPKTSVDENELSTDTDSGDFGLINGMYMIKAGINYSFGDLKETSATSYMPKVYNLKLFDRIYIGAGAGLASTQFDAFLDSDSDSNAEIIDRKSDTGGLGYIQIGRDWQFNNNFVLGLNLDYQILNNKVKGSGADDDTVSVKSKDITSIRGKLGYLLSERILTYGTLGLASYRAEVFHQDADESGKKSFNKINLFLGGGVEWFMPASDNVSFQLEGLYFPTRVKKNIAEDSLTSSTDGLDFAQVNHASIVKFGINYSF